MAEHRKVRPRREDGPLRRRHRGDIRLPGAVEGDVGQPVSGQEADHLVGVLGDPRLVPELDGDGPAGEAAGQRGQVFERPVTVPNPRRELEEELGVVAGKLTKLTEFFVSPGFLEEKIWIYLATELTTTQQRLEDDEMLDIVRLPLRQALQMITDGEIEDAKTIIGLMLAAPHVGPAMLETDYPAV